MRGEGAGAIGIEVAYMLITEMEGLYSFAIHLVFNFIEYLVGFVPPIH